MSRLIGMNTMNSDTNHTKHVARLLIALTVLVGFTMFSGAVAATPGDDVSVDEPDSDSPTFLHENCERVTDSFGPHVGAALQEEEEQCEETLTSVRDLVFGVAPDE